MRAFEYQAQTGVPFPRHIGGTPGNTKYPWPDLSVGDSFFVPHGDHRMSAVSIGYGKRHNTKYTLKCQVEDGVAGVRVWRVS